MEINQTLRFNIGKLKEKNFFLINIDKLHSSKILYQSMNVNKTVLIDNNLDF